MDNKLEKYKEAIRKLNMDLSEEELEYFASKGEKLADILFNCFRENIQNKLKDKNKNATIDVNPQTRQES
ncbi:MAG: hypothetical protein WCW16_03060 [Candidatus Magasanikbacteria bacterium]